MEKPRKRTADAVNNRKTVTGRRNNSPMAKRISSLSRLHDSAVLPLKRKMPIKRVAVSLILACFGAISLIGLQLKIEQLSSRIKELNQTRNNLESINQYLRLKIDKATAYEEIFPIINTKFGMDLQSPSPVILEVPEHVLSGKKRK